MAALEICFGAEIRQVYLGSSRMYRTTTAASMQRSFHNYYENLAASLLRIKHTIYRCDFKIAWVNDGSMDPILYFIVRTMQMPGEREINSSLCHVRYRFCLFVVNDFGFREEPK